MTLADLQLDRRELIAHALELVETWEAKMPPCAPHGSSTVSAAAFRDAWDEFAARMSASLPFFHPRYAGHMTKPPHPVALAAQLAAMAMNPNNHALDASPATSRMEHEVIEQLAGMLGLPALAIGHLTSGGTVANLEALWVAHELRPGRSVVVGRNAHYTHERVAAMLGLPIRMVDADGCGRIDLAAVERECRRGDVGTVVLTAGTTGLGVVDAIDQALVLRERYDVRLHVDAAYGGFFAVLADGAALAAPVAAALRAVAAADSVVIDPHKHGLQPYGCGAVLFRDPAVRRVYRHDAPYTYFTRAGEHLGEISLECSRPGAPAAGLWFTLRMLPPTEAGLGSVLQPSIAAAREWERRLEAHDELRVYAHGDLDIVTYFPDAPTAAAVDRRSRAVLEAGMADPEDPVFLSLLRIEATQLARRRPELTVDADQASVLRSVLMKPEHHAAVPDLIDRIASLARVTR